jgi:hypothetical protein
MLEIYILSENTIQEFKNNSLKKLPQKNEKDKNWQKYDWSKKPIDSSFNEIFVLCLNYSTDNQKLKVKIEEIKKLKRKGEIYYSFYYRPDKENPQNAQLFILDIQNRKLYAIDQQI